jgi:hypothetical protein
VRGVRCTRGLEDLLFVLLVRVLSSKLLELLGRRAKKPPMSSLTAKTLAQIEHLLFPTVEKDHATSLPATAPDDIALNGATIFRRTSRHGLSLLAHAMVASARESDHRHAHVAGGIGRSPKKRTEKKADPVQLTLARTGGIGGRAGRVPDACRRKARVATFRIGGGHGSMGRIIPCT